MISKTIVALLSLATVLMTSAQQCSNYNGSPSITTSVLMTSVAKWYGQIISVDNSSCTNVTFQNGSINFDNVIMTTRTIRPNGNMDQSALYLEYVAPGEYNVWYTGRLKFDPQNPDRIGNYTVPKIGQLKFFNYYNSAGVTAFTFIKCIIGAEDVYVTATSVQQVSQGSLDTIEGNLGGVYANHGRYYERLGKNCSST